MTRTKTQRVEMLKEVLAEIWRLNDVAGETVFNPAATACVRELLAEEGVPLWTRGDAARELDARFVAAKAAR